MQDVDGGVHGDLLFQAFFAVFEAAIASRLAPTGECIAHVGASLLAIGPSSTRRTWRRMGSHANCTTRNKSPRPAPSR
ncbi:hypothetical protein FGE05_22195 [Pseudomonas sp. ICMP22404]|nr:hypothetical protein FGE05_22195 [Pseudomonas sp. ICMP22404]